MLDIKLLREQTDYVKAALGRAGIAPTEIDQVLEVDARRRRLQHDLDEMRARRTRESKELGRLAPAEREARRLEMRQLGDQISAGERELTAIEHRFDELMLGLRNLPRDWVLDLKRDQGYLEIIPPLMVNTATATSTGHLPKNADTMYRDIEEDFWFI